MQRLAIYLLVAITGIFGVVAAIVWGLVGAIGIAVHESMAWLRALRSGTKQRKEG